jgi:hypothetical protein
MIETIITIAVVIAVAALLYYFLKEGMTLIINAVVGLVCLYLINFFHLIGYIGGTDLPISWATVIICALGGVIGVVLLVLLNLMGITV